MNNLLQNAKLSLKEHYFVFIPIVITFLLYVISLTFGFRNFDEDVIIKEFYTNKTIGEYLEKYILTNISGITSAYGFAFSSIQNVHWCPLERPLFYLVSYLFKANPFLFHALGLVLHLITTAWVTLLAYNVSKNKHIALFSGLIWSIHPINVEPVIWATNWPAVLGALLYFFTLNLVAKSIHKDSLRKVALLSAVLFLIQLLIVEHCISLPIIIFALSYFLSLQTKNTEPLKQGLKIALPSFIVAITYLVIRFFFVSNVAQSTINTLPNTFERILFITPQILIHHLQLLFFPLKLSIDQLDLLKLDNSLFGVHHISSIVTCLLLTATAYMMRKKFPYIALGVFCYVIALTPFLQIIPLYSLVAERYNYFASAFLIFAIVSLVSSLLKNKKTILVILLIAISILSGSKSFGRITEWKDSKTLFLSTINSSQSLFKKGIWTYNLAISEDSKQKEQELLSTSQGLLELFLKNIEDSNSTQTLKTYELDSISLKAKAYLRLSKISNLLGNQGQAIAHLKQVLSLTDSNSPIHNEANKLLATHAFERNDFKEAIRLYKKSNQIHQSPTVDYAIAACYLKLNDLKNYEKYLRKAVSIISLDNTKPFKTYGQFLELQKGNLNEAKKMYKTASLLENDPIPYSLLTTLQLKQNKIDDAFKTVKRGLHSFPTNPDLVYLNGAILINKGNNSAGKAALEQVLTNNKAKNSLRTEAGNILVNILLKENNIEGAKKYNDLILAIDPQNLEALRRQQTADNRLQTSNN